MGIANVLKKYNIDVLFREEKNNKLLKSDGKYSDKKGFIGGATLVFDKKFVLFGDIDKLDNKSKIIEHIKKYNLELIDFKNIDVIDYGSGIVF